MKPTRKQLSLIHVAKSRLGLTDDDYRTILRRAAGVESSRDLDPLGFELTMDELHRLGFESDFAARNLGRRRGMASLKQVNLIHELWAEYTGGAGDDRGLDRWIERTFKVGSIRFLTPTMARKAITALFAMARRVKA